MKKSCRVLISACLFGCKCNYKQSISSYYQERLSDLQSAKLSFDFFPICPEQLGGLPTPRVPAELQGVAVKIFAGEAVVLNIENKDLTYNFISGAEETLRLAKILNIDFAVLKSRSPSCGSKQVYDGTFSSRLVEGQGLTAYLLKSSGIKTLNELEFLEFLSVQGSGSLV